jgi:predicted ATPase/serine phosphatase RsbU (regulator of sigma subunit)/tRNA A-37 threonylcarbamoyl transferase component Bud32
MIAIAGYEVQTKLYESSRSIVYRGQDANGRTVILKAMRSESPSREEQERYQAEYSILSRLDLPGVVKAYALELDQQRSVLVLEDIQGQSLKRWLQARPLTLTQFLRVALVMTQSLGQVHAAQIIHKDINPNNIVLAAGRAGLDDPKVQLIDFGSASLMRREMQTPDHPVSLEGSLAYLSPEQTGRMNRSLDYRTDFYSLGVTWYEALSGAPPFAADDAMQIVYFHLAKQPQPLHQLNPQIPEMLSELVLKLLAKNAEDRYQSAEGIQADLQICLQELEQHGQISPFGLAQQDRSGRFEIPAKLYGRAAEQEQLWASFERISRPAEQAALPQRELVLVSGYAGVGKSTLVQELYRPITARRGYLIAGKFDQLQRNLPYSALVTALTDLVRQLLSQPTEALLVWQKRFLQALGANGQVITDVIPEFRLIVGEQTALPSLGLAESKNRFDRAFQAFVRVCCRPEHPLVIFLDDLQWADAASLNWIKLILSDLTIQHLLLIGAYRDHEVNLGHPLLLLLQDLQAVPITPIKLRPLGLEQVSQLVADALQIGTLPASSILPLVQRIMQKTGGNPFFVQELLKTLHAEQILSFDSTRRQWQWQLQRIDALGISDNVVDLMLNRLARLPAATQQILALAACIGPKFEAQTLAIVCQCSIEELTQPLAAGLEAELIWTTAKPDLQLRTYRFAHDRVQQAAYSLIPALDQQATHLKIGQLLLECWDGSPQSAQIFEIVDHLNRGRDLLTEPQARTNLAELNLKAAQRAKQATAYSAAQEYLQTGLSLAEPWQPYALTLSLHQEMAELNYLLGDFAAARTLVQTILERATSPLDQAEAYNLLIIQETVRSHYAEAIQAGRAALKLLGVDLPEQDLAAVFEAEQAKLKANLRKRSLTELLELPDITDPGAKLVVKLLSNLGSAAYRYQQQLWQVIVMLSLNFFCEQGNLPESCYGYSNYGTLLGSVLGDYAAGYESCLVSLRLSERYGNLTQKTRACFILSNFVHAWVRPAQQADAINREGIQAGLESGEIQYVGYSLSYRVTNLFFQGKPLNLLLEDLLEATQFCQRSQNQWAIDALGGYQLTLFHLLDIPTDPVWQKLPPVDAARFPETCAAHQSFSGLCRYHILTCLSLYLDDQLQAARIAAEAATLLLPYILGVVSIAEHCFYSSLVLAGLYATATTSEQAKFQDQLLANKQQLQTWAAHCPENFSHLDRLIEAELARINGQTWQAAQAYDQAIQMARQQGFILHEALANDCAAQFWLSHKKPDFARLYLRQAHREYRRWGANRKVYQLETRFPQFFSSNRSSNSLDETVNQSAWSEMLDLETLLKASQAISSEIVLEKLLAQLMTILLENAGAQRGYLLLPQANQLQIEVEGQSDRADPIQVRNQPLSETLLPLSLISYVQRTGEAVVLTNATAEGRFRTDPYILDRQPQSLLCLPILNQGKLIGLLYLENNLITGAFTPERMTILQVLSAQAAIALENASFYRTLEQKVEARTQELASANQEIMLLNQRLKTENLRMSAELAVARQIQQMMLPKQAELEQIPLLDICGFMEPADEVGGDYYDVLQTGDMVTIGIGDITGHGLESGLLMLMLQTAIRTLVLAGNREAVKFFQTLNQVIYENAHRINSERNLTLAVLEYELSSGCLRLSGQHEEMLVVRANQQMQRIDTIDLGFPIGLVAEIEQFIDQIELKLSPGDGIVLYTDGIPEAANLAGDFYGLERLYSVICEFWSRPAAAICEAVIQDLKLHIGEQKVFDDVTLLVVKRKTDNSSTSSE